MQVLRHWQGLPYYPISQHYRSVFGEKVVKVPVSVAESCPNRDGLNGGRACTFCDEWGSAAYPEFRELNLKYQILNAMKRIKLRFNTDKYLVYFQAYTNSYDRVKLLRRHFEVAASLPNVLGIVVGTRPDCISDATLDLWNEYSQKFYFAVELGAQSFSDKQLEWMARGHNSQRTLKAVERIRLRAPDVRLGLHLMFGWPGETDSEVVQAAHICNALQIDDVKLHNLHVLKNTELAEQFMRGEFNPISRRRYARQVVSFCQNLSPEIAVHRLAAVASRHDELVAPSWAKSKLETYQYILQEFRERNAYQGQFYSQHSEESWDQRYYFSDEANEVTNLT